MGAVYVKEMRQYRHSLSGVAFLAAYSALTGYCFMTGSLFAQNGRAANLFAALLSLLMILIPVLTMHQFAEERKTRTEQLLLTSPVSLRSLVLGKYLAAMTLFALANLPLAADVAIMAGMGCWQPLETAGNSAALLLAGSGFIAVGLFASALTESQVVAAIISYALLIGLWLLGAAARLVHGPVWVTLIRFLSFRGHFEELAGGMFSLTALAYFAGLTALMLTLTELLLRMRQM